MFFWFIFLAIVIIISKHIYEIHNYNYEAIPMSLQTAYPELISEKLKERKPLLLHNLGNKDISLRDLTFKNLVKDNPGHIIYDKNRYISLKSFDEEDNEQMNIYKNKDLSRQFNLNKGFDERFFMYLEDLDLSCRIKDSGFDSMYLSDVYITHFCGGSSQKVKSYRLFYSLRLE